MSSLLQCIPDIYLNSVISFVIVIVNLVELGYFNWNYLSFILEHLYMEVHVEFHCVTVSLYSGICVILVYLHAAGISMIHNNFFFC